MEISPDELKKILDNICRKHGLEIGNEGFSIETCRSMVAVMDSDSTGKLGFHEFKFLWGNIKKWQGIFKKYDGDRSGCISSQELPGALAEAGFRLNDPRKATDNLYSLIVRRYADQHGDMDFDSFVGCLVRLDTMCRAFKTLDKDNNGTIDLGIEEWLQLTMYS
ncbi:calpain small subunit 1-like [Eucyclogobius newberryi]|uniref:calpain small subunit 1-like n=1 Tax=Eucyclogobius newberryi TaxID=166745 RepID=UPI003B5906F9